ncbi:MAG: hypothetical protein LC802_11165 [Acidobacteria bacterium]|nr:hypothetical protein [Acidobacteriota bacterium]
MCLDSGMLIGLLLFLLCVTASPFVVIAAIVHICRKNRTDEPIQILG